MAMVGEAGNTVAMMTVCYGGSCNVSNTRPSTHKHKQPHTDLIHRTSMWFENFLELL